MADDSDDPDMAAERLEAALERIAQLSAARAAAAAAAVAAVAEQTAAPPADPSPEPPAVEEEDLTADVAARLDSLIARLRSALATGAA